MTSPPGTTLFAPQARFMLEDGEQVAIEPVDLQSVRVTLAHHGISQVSLSLGNQRTVDGRPVDPSWKYNDLSALRFGKRFKVELRYGVEVWEPMILGRITDVSFSFPSSGPATVRVEARDMLSLLDIKPTQDRRYRDKSEVEIVQDVLTRSETGLSLAAPLIDRPVMQDALRSLTHRKSQTYFKFIESMAERMDFEVFADIDGRLHFEPARSLTLDGVVDLGWRENLVSLTPKFKVWEQYTSATAKGRSPRSRTRIDETVQGEAIRADLQQESGQAAPLDAMSARDRFFGSEFGSVPANEAAIDVANLDRERARLKATAVLRQRAREFLTASASTIGFPLLKPGIHVNIKNMHAPFDGLYYVTKAVHTLDGSGYKTDCELRRPGMLPPEN